MHTLKRRHDQREIIIDSYIQGSFKLPGEDEGILALKLHLPYYSLQQWIMNLL